MKAILLKELRDALRSRWLLGYAGLLAFLGLLVAWAGLDGASGLSLQVFGRTTATLINLCLLLAPLVALTLGAASIAGEVERGSLPLLLAQPIERWELLAGKYLGLLAALCMATVAGFLPAGLVLAGAGGAGDLGRFALFPLLATVVAASLLGVGMRISVTADSAVQAQSLAIFTWFALVLLYDLVVLGVIAGGGVPTGLVATLLALNPVDSARVLAVLALEPDLYVLGPAGSMLTGALGNGGAAALLGGSLLLWATVPLASAVSAFRLRVPRARRRDETTTFARRALMKTPLVALAVLLVCTLPGCGGDPGTGAALDEPAGDSPAVRVARLEHGRATYIANCAPCHGSGGRGDGPSAANLDPKPRDHTDAAYMKTLSDGQLADTIRYGGAIVNMPQMPSHPHLQGEELDDLVAFVRSLSDSAGDGGEV